MTTTNNSIEQNTSPRQRVTSWFRSLDRVEVIGGTTLAALSIGAVVLAFKGSDWQDKGYMNDVRDETAEVIPGFVDVKVDGTIINGSEGSIHNAIVLLASGQVCDIQFTPVDDDGFLGFLMPTHDARVVSYGNCPTIDE